MSSRSASQVLPPGCQVSVQWWKSNWAPQKLACDFGLSRAGTSQPLPSLPLSSSLHKQLQSETAPWALSYFPRLLPWEDLCFLSWNPIQKCFWLWNMDNIIITRVAKWYVEAITTRGTGQCRVSFLKEITFQAGSEQCHRGSLKLIGWQSNYNMYLIISYIVTT